MTRAAPAKRYLAVIDMAVSVTSPAGSCVRAIVCGLRSSRSVDLFSSEWDAAASAGGVSYHAVHAPSKPVLLRYLVFHARVASMLRAWLKGRSRGQTLVQATQGQWVGADIVYAHFCHGAYLPSLWQQAQWRSARFWMRVCTHAFNAWRERLAFECAAVVVAPSQGLKRELMAHYGLPSDKIEVLPNPVDIERFARPADLNRTELRHQCGADDGDVLMAFMALGDFERKGLDLVLKAMARFNRGAKGRLRLVVIGGQPAEIAEFQHRAKKLGVADQVRFVGMQKDVRPYLWAADVFAFPSAYEIFSLAILQAAAAGLPVLVSQGLYGAEEFVEPLVNGWVVPRDVAGVEAALQDMLGKTPEGLMQMGDQACATVQQYAKESFVRRWQALYRRMGLE